MIFRKSVGNVQVLLNHDKNNGTVHVSLIMFIVIKIISLQHLEANFEKKKLFPSSMSFHFYYPLTEMSTRNIFWGVKAAGA